MKCFEDEKGKIVNKLSEKVEKLRSSERFGVPLVESFSLLKKINLEVACRQSFKPSSKVDKMTSIEFCSRYSIALLKLFTRESSFGSTSCSTEFHQQI